MVQGLWPVRRGQVPQVLFVSTVSIHQSIVIHKWVPVFMVPQLMIILVIRSVYPGMARNLWLVRLDITAILVEHMYSNIRIPRKPLPRLRPQCQQRLRRSLQSSPRPQCPPRPRPRRVQSPMLPRRFRLQTAVNRPRRYRYW